MPAERQTTVRYVTSLGSRLRACAFWSLPKGAQVWLLAVEVLALTLAGVLLHSQAITLRSGLLLIGLTVLALTWNELARRNERIRAYLSVDQRQIYPVPRDIWTFAALVVAPSGWAVCVVVVLYAQTAWHAANDQTHALYRTMFNTSATIVAQATAGYLTDFTDHRTTGVVDVLLLIAGAVVFSAVEFFVVLIGMWQAMERPPLRGLLPDKDTLTFVAACLSIGLTAGILLLHAPLAVIVLLIPVALLQRGTLVAALHASASSDSKTGVTNAGAWQRNAQTLLDTCRVDGKSAAVLLIDIDNFRTINNTVGHLAADQILVSVAETLRAEVRNDDCTGRFGGDEFVVIVEDVDQEQAMAIGERIRASVAAKLIELESGESVSATVSIGLAYAAPGALPATINDLLDRADKALYASKAAGRDYVSLNVVAA